MVLIHWAHLVALALLVGGLSVRLAVLAGGRRIKPDDVAFLETARRRTHAILWWAVVAAVVTLALEVVQVTLALNTTYGFVPALHALLFGTRFGEASLARWLLLVAAVFAVDEVGRAPAMVVRGSRQRGRQALGIVAHRPQPSPPMLTAYDWLRIAAVLAVAITIATAVAGPRGSSIGTALVDTLHLAATLLWFGGTITIATVVAPAILLVERERRPLALVTVLDRFAPLAAGSAAVMFATGLFEGRVTEPRTLLLVALLAVSLWSAMVSRPGLRRAALRVRRGTLGAEEVATQVELQRRLLWVNPVLAVLALLFGVASQPYPGQAALTSTRSQMMTPKLTYPFPAKRTVDAVVPHPQGVWQQLGPITIVRSLLADPANQTLLYEGTNDGVYRSLDGGAHWLEASHGLSAPPYTLASSAREVWSLTLLPDHSLVAATGAGIYRSTDAAQHWRAAGLARTESGRPRAIYTLAAHLAGHVVLLAGGDGGIFRSDNLAAGWHQVYDSGAASVMSLAWPSIRPRFAVAGTTSSLHPLVISHDGGDSWHDTMRGLPQGTGALSVAVAPGAHDLYAGTYGSGIYTMPGIAGTWLGRSSGLPTGKSPSSAVGSFAFDVAQPATIYAATDSGVYRTVDAGLHWLLFGSGLSGDAAVVNALTLVTGPHPFLYAATAAGLYRLPLPVHTHGAGPATCTYRCGATQNRIH